MQITSWKTTLWVAAVCSVPPALVGAQQTDTSKQAQQTDTSKQAQQADTSKQTQQADTSKQAQQADTSKQAQQADTSKQAQQTDTSKPAQQADTSKSAATSSARKDTTQKPTARAEQAQPTPKAKPSAPPVRVDVDDLASEPAQYTGKNVRVRGEIEEFVGPRVFTLDEDSFTATTDVLVVLPRASVVLRDDAEVVVQGVVHQLTRAQLERDYGFLGADPHWLVQFEQRPVILATALQSQKGKDLLVGAKAAEDGKTQAKAKPVNVSPEAVARSPEKYYGRELTVKGEIEDVFGRYVFTLDEDALFAGPDVLVVMRRPAAAVIDGADVRVTGTLRRFTWTEIRPDYDFLGLENDLIVRFENRPVLLADSVSRASED